MNKEQLNALAWEHYDKLSKHPMSSTEVTEHLTEFGLLVQARIADNLKEKLAAVQNQTVCIDPIEGAFLNGKEYGLQTAIDLLSEAE